MSAATLDGFPSPPVKLRIPELGGVLPGAYTATGYTSNGRGASGYQAAYVTRTSGQPYPREGSPDFHLRYDRELLGDIAEYMDRNNSVYETVLNRSTEWVLGRTGFGLQPKTGDESLDERLKADWRRWSRKPEITGRHSWAQCEELAYRAHCNRGDLGVVPVRDRDGTFRVMYVTAPRITGGRRAARAAREGGRVEQGVELDALNRTLAYWVAPRDRHGRVLKAKAKRMRSEELFLYAHRKGFDQARGVPVLASVFPMLHRLGDVLDSEAIAWQLLARLAVAINREGGASLAFQESAKDEDGRDPGSGATSEGGDADVADRYHEIDEGPIVFHGEPGESIRGIDRNLPGKDFPQSIRAFYSMIGAPFGIPGSVLLLDLRGLNYTSSRAEVEQACLAHHKRQRDLADGHHTPIYEAFVRAGIEDGRYPDEPEVFDHGWSTPSFPWTDRLKEGQAWQLMVGGGMAVQEDALRSAGYTSHAEYVDRRGTEIARAMRKAREINAELEEGESPVDWRHFAGIEVSTQQSAPVSERPPADTPPPGEDPEEPEGDEEGGEE